MRKLWLIATVCLVAACSGSDTEAVNPSLTAVSRVGAAAATMPVAEPLDPALKINSPPPPAPLGDRGYWSKVSFRLLGDLNHNGQPDCGPGDEQYPCYYPLRAAPDFRKANAIVTNGWPQ